MIKKIIYDVMIVKESKFHLKKRFYFSLYLLHLTLNKLNNFFILIFYNYKYKYYYKNTFCLNKTYEP